MEFYIKMPSFDFAPPIGIASSSNLCLKEAILCYDTDNLSESACLLHCVGFGKGSGVVIGIRNDNIIIESNSIRALILTAGHVIGRSLGKYTEINVSFDFSGQREFVRAILIKDFSDWSEPPQIDQITGCPYAMPNDIALIGLLELPSRIRESEIEQDFNYGDQISIVGYPKMPKIIEYCAPFLKNDSDIANKVSKAFCGFGKRVKSEGTIMNTFSSEMISGNYSATSGMSGGPIFSASGKILGINTGGAALPFQFDVGQIISLGRQGNWSDALKKFQQLKTDIKSSKLFYLSSNELKSAFGYTKIAIKYKKISDLVNFGSKLIQALAINYNMPEALDHNVCISCKHPIFNLIRHSVDVFKTLPTCNFVSIADFTTFIGL